MNWPAIFASALLSLILVIGVFAWIVTHPNKPPQPSKTMSTAAIASTAKTMAEPSALPAPPPVIETAVALHRSPDRDAVVNDISLIEEDAPPLPPPAPPRRRPEPADAPAPPHPAGQTYGTQVLFLNNQAVAADMARKNHKLLFVMHISGNFENACFT